MPKYLLLNSQSAALNRAERHNPPKTSQVDCRSQTPPSTLPAPTIEMIRKLPKEVINKIAAGEVIQRPYNVIKELIENSIDAEATHIRLTIAQGGLQLIQLVDNGSGIKREDFPLLCERFATSKLQEVSDLETINSFGFRGEALASLSYVSQLEITSKYKDASVGYRCCFRDEKMVEQPEPVSMNTGTKIRAVQLFGGLETRRSSLNAGEEKRRIIRLASHFALHYHWLRVSVDSQKGAELAGDVRSSKISQSKMKMFQLITRLPYDKFSYLPQQTVDEARVQAIITKLNTTKGKSLLLNVNNRIVECPEITKAVERAYADCYQSIHEDNETYFVYLSLQLDPRKIDCNQHPSKKQIGFFAADRLFEGVYQWVLAHIKEESSIKNIVTNLPAAKLRPVFNSQRLENVGKEEGKGREGGKQEKKGSYAYEKNRTDSKQLPINFFLKGGPTGQQDRQLQIRLETQLEGEQAGYVREFFKQASYVGCFNLNYIFVHFDNCLHLLNLLPFLPPFIREWLKTNPLLLHRPDNTRTHLALRDMVGSFLRRRKLEGRVDVEDILDKVLINRHLLSKEYGLFVEESADGRDGRVVGYPVFAHFMGDCMQPDEIAYFLCRLFKGEPGLTEREGYYVDLLVSLFREEEEELSPMNDKYSEFLRDRVLPLLKTKCRHFGSIVLTNYFTKMLDLKDVYKIFERC